MRARVRALCLAGRAGRERYSAVHRWDLKTRALRASLDAHASAVTGAGRGAGAVDGAPTARAAIVVADDGALAFTAGRDSVLCVLALAPRAAGCVAASRAARRARLSADSGALRALRTLAVGERVEALVPLGCGRWRSWW